MTGAVLVLAGVCAGAVPAARSAWVTRRADIVSVRTEGIELITGPPLARLKDARSLRLQLDLAVSGAQAGPFVPIAKPRFVLSYDLWEERVAVVRTDVPRSISHLTVRDAEAWCIEQLSLPVAAYTSRLSASTFWIRLTRRLEDEDPGKADPESSGLTIRGLIDRFSRRQATDAWTDTVVSGPLRLE